MGSSFDLSHNEYLNFGRTLALNASGDRLVVGAYITQENEGILFTYELSGTSWTPLGSPAELSQNEYFSFGQTVALNASGNILVTHGVAAQEVPYYDESIFTYEYIDTSWNKLEDLCGNDGLTWFGSQFALNAVGDRLVATRWAGGTGTILTYTRTDASWTQYPLELSNNGYNDFGQTLALNGSGDILVVGATHSDISGVVLTYQWNNSSSSWVPVDTHLTDNSENLFGAGLALNHQGNKLVAFAAGGGYDNSGFLHTYT